MAKPEDDLFSEAEDNTEEARADYASIRAPLDTRVVGREDVLDQLPLVAFLHRRGTALHRLLLAGPSGAGKTHVARAIAEVSGAPFLVIDAQQITEAGWSGLHLDEFLAGFVVQVKNPALLARSLVLVDELDKVRIHPSAHGNALDKPRAVQTSLLGLFGVGAPVRFGTGANNQLDPAHLRLWTGGRVQWLPSSSD